MFKLKVTAMGASLLMSSLSAFAQEESPWFANSDFSASVALTTDYTFRGITQSAGDAAIQGSFDWSSDLLYVGIWASTVDFNDDLVDPFTGEQVSDGTSTEIDFYAGVTPSVGDVDLSFGAIYYFYPDAPQGDDDIFTPEGDLFFDSLEQNYFELNAGASYAVGDVELGFTTAWSPDYYFEAGDSFYTEVSVGLPLWSGNVSGKDVSLSASGTIGYLEFFDDADAADGGFEDYVNYGIGATLSVWGFDLDARFIDTASLAGNGNTGVFTLSRSF